MTSLTILRTRLARPWPPIWPPIWRWMAVRRERRRLSELSDHALHDIGITRAEARHEAARPFWELPDR